MVPQLLSSFLFFICGFHLQGYTNMESLLHSLILGSKVKMSKLLSLPLEILKQNPIQCWVLCMVWICQCDLCCGVRELYYCVSREGFVSLLVCCDFCDGSVKCGETELSYFYRLRTNKEGTGGGLRYSPLPGDHSVPTPSPVHPRHHALQQTNGTHSLPPPLLLSFLYLVSNTYYSILWVLFNKAPVRWLCCNVVGSTIRI